MCDDVLRHQGAATSDGNTQMAARRWQHADGRRQPVTAVREVQNRESITRHSERLEARDAGGGSGNTAAELT